MIGGVRGVALTAGLAICALFETCGIASANDYVNIMLAFDAKAAQSGLAPGSGWDSVQVQQAQPWAFVRARNAAGDRYALLQRNRDATWGVISIGSGEPHAPLVAAVGARRTKRLLAQCAPTARNTMMRAHSGKTLELTGMSRVRGKLVFLSTKLRGVAFSCP